MKGPIMYVPQMSALLNRWFMSYKEASASLQAEGGYLLPYGEQFFITEQEGIRALGLDPDDADWEKIGWDWIRPLDVVVWNRLNERRGTLS